MDQRIGLPLPQDRTAVVSGCGSARGIGRATAMRLVEAGWSVAVVDIDEAIFDFERELEEKFPSAKVHALRLDVSDKDAVARGFAELDDSMPPIVGEANIAGIACPKSIFEIDVDEFDRVVAVNLRGTMLMMRSAAERMREVGVGRIVNFSSITALDGGGTFSKFAYAAAKAGVLGLSRGGARELGPLGITCNAVLPGPIDTDIMGGRLTEERKERMSSDIPVGRVGQPADVAAVVNFLLSEEAGFVNGVALNVDGGKHMH